MAMARTSSKSHTVARGVLAALLTEADLARSPRDEAARLFKVAQRRRIPTTLASLQTALYKARRAGNGSASAAWKHNGHGHSNGNGNGATSTAGGEAAPLESTFEEAIATARAYVVGLSEENRTLREQVEQQRGESERLRGIVDQFKALLAPAGDGR